MKKYSNIAVLLIFFFFGITYCTSMFSQISYLGKISHHEDGTYGLVGTMSICFSIDKQHIYVSGQYSLAVFNYDESTGDTEFVEAYRNENDGNNGLYSPSCVKVSPDNKYVYVSSDYYHCISLYKRNTSTGTLELLKIFYDTDEGFDGLGGAHEIGISETSKYLYVAALSDAKISVFGIDSTTGYLSYIQSVSSYDEGGLSWPKALKLSKDSRFVYVPSHVDDELSVFEINPLNGELVFVETIAEVSGHYNFSTLEISHDNKYLYLAGISSLGIYSREIETGKLTLVKLFKYDDPGISGMSTIYSMTVSPDDKNIYVITAGDTSFVTFSRNISDNEFQFTDSKPFMSTRHSNYNYSNTCMISDYNYVFGASYWESGVHCTKRNQSDGALSYERFIYQGEDANIDGLYNPRSCCADKQQKMVYVSTHAQGISIFQRNDTTGKLIYKNVANNKNQHSGMLYHINKIVLSKDGNYLYALCQYYKTTGIAIFEVNHATDNLILIDSIMSDTYGSTGIDDPRDIAFSPNGEHLYVVSSFNQRGIAQFSYNPQTGSLTLDNFYEIDNTGELYDNISISNNGRYVFIWNTNSDDITMLGRNSSTGELTYLSTSSLNTIGEVYLYGLKHVSLSPDNRNLYAAYGDCDIMVNYSIDSLNNKLDVLQVFNYESSAIEGLQQMQQIVTRNDGTFVYTSSYKNNSLGLFYRDQSNGMLTFLKDYTEVENNFNGLDRINGICIPKDDRNLYITSSIEEAIASYSIDLYLGPDLAICEDDSALLDAGKGYTSYQWSTNENTQRVYAKQEGYYHVMTTDEFGFVDYDTMYLTVYQKPELDLGADISSCIGSTVTLNSGFDGENLWNTGATSESITVNSSGMYLVSITDNHFCKNSDSIQVIFHHLPDIDLGADTTISLNQTLKITVDNIPDYEYLWYDGSINSSVIITGNSITNSPLLVWLQITNQFGCRNEDIVLISLDTTSVYADHIKLEVEPVPTVDIINIESNYIISKTSLYDSHGKFLFSREPNSLTSVLNINDRSNGSYYLRITLNNGFIKTFKLIKL